MATIGAWVIVLIAVLSVGVTVAVAVVAGMSFLQSVVVCWLSAAAALLMFGLLAGGKDIATRAGRSRW